MPLTLLQRKYGPFAFPTIVPELTHVTVCSVADRIALVKDSTDADWLGYVLTHAEQKSVRLAAARRLKWVNKAVAGLMAKYKAQEEAA
jgi:hypothetical protein